MHAFLDSGLTDRDLEDQAVDAGRGGRLGILAAVEPAKRAAESFADASRERLRRTHPAPRLDLVQLSVQIEGDAAIILSVQDQPRPDRLPLAEPVAPPLA